MCGADGYKHLTSALAAVSMRLLLDTQPCSACSVVLTFPQVIPHAFPAQCRSPLHTRLRDIFIHAQHLCTCVVLPMPLQCVLHTPNTAILVLLSCSLHWESCLSVQTNTHLGIHRVLPCTRANTQCALQFDIHTHAGHSTWGRACVLHPIPQKHSLWYPPGRTK